VRTVRLLGWDQCKEREGFGVRETEYTFLYFRVTVIPGTQEFGGTILGTSGMGNEILQN